MKIFLIIFIVWLVLFLFTWALVHGAKLQRERMGFFEDDRLRVKLPSKSVTVPLVVPCSMMVAPMMPSPLESFTVP